MDFKLSCKICFSENLVNDDVTSSRDNIVDYITQLAEQHIPVIKTSPNPCKRPLPYWSKECTDAVKRRNAAKNKMQRTRDLDDRIEYYRL